MKKSLVIAIGIQAIIMIAVLIPPLVTLQTGETVYLETLRIDPRALFRGDYVTLDYEVGFSVDKETARQAYDAGLPIYVVVTMDRPAQFVSALLTEPTLKEGQACVVARATQNVLWDEPTPPRFPEQEDVFRTTFVRFPQISQYFVPEGTGMAIEEEIDDMVAELSVTDGCNAVVRGLEML